MSIRNYITLDCRDGNHAACAECNCLCHDESLTDIQARVMDETIRRYQEDSLLSPEEELLVSIFGQQLEPKRRLVMGGVISHGNLTLVRKAENEERWHPRD